MDLTSISRKPAAGISDSLAHAGGIGRRPARTDGPGAGSEFGSWHCGDSDCEDVSLPREQMPQINTDASSGPSTPRRVTSYRCKSSPSSRDVLDHDVTPLGVTVGYLPL